MMRHLLRPLLAAFILFLLGLVLLAAGSLLLPADADAAVFCLAWFALIAFTAAFGAGRGQARAWWKSGLLVALLLWLGYLLLLASLLPRLLTPAVALLPAAGLAPLCLLAALCGAGFAEAAAQLKREREE